MDRDPCEDEEKPIFWRIDLSFTCSRFMQLAGKRRPDNRRTLVRTIFKVPSQHISQILKKVRFDLDLRAIQLLEYQI